MRKLINTNKDITISELCELLRSGRQLIVYYRTNNNKTGYPVFLKWDKYGHSFFFSPVASMGNAFLADTLEDCLSTAIISRHIYVIDKEEQNKLFKIHV